MAWTPFTIQSLIDEALQILGILEPGTTLSSGQYADLLRTMNMLQDEWNAQEGLIPVLATGIFPLVAGRSTYLIGPGATTPDFVGLRIERLLQANVFQGSGTTAVRIPLRLEDLLESTARNPFDLPGAPYPQTVSVSGQTDVNGSNSLTFWPTPTQAISCELTYHPMLLNQASGLGDPVYLPPAYARMYVYNFAVAVAPKFGKTPSPDIIQQAANALRNVRNASYRPIRRSRASKGGGLYWNYISGTMERAQ